MTGGGLLWRLRAELAAAEAGDFQAVAVLAAGAADEPPASVDEAYEAVHLQLRLEQLARENLVRVGRALEILPHFRRTTAPQPRLDLRR